MPYLEGLRALDADPSASLALEDSRSGIQSATAAGVATVGIATDLAHDEIMAAGAVAAADDDRSPHVSGWMLERLGTAL